MSYFLYKLGLILAEAAPVSVSYRVASFIADIKYLFARVEKREMVENLRLVLPGTDEKTLKVYARHIFVNFSMYLVDFFRFKKIDLEYLNGHAQVINREGVDKALKRGKGIIVLSAHLGSWELGGAIMGMLGYDISVIALDHKNKSVNEFFVNQRRAKNEKVISINIALKRCFTALRGNGLLAIVGDKDFTNNGIVTKFFGKDTLLPKGPAVFSLKTGAVIMPGFTIRKKDDNFQLIFEDPIEYTPTGDFDRDVVNLTALCTKALEKNIRKYPTQWYCFRRFWQE